TELATTSLDQMREFSRSVIAIALIAAIKAGFVGKLVGGRNRVSNTLPFFYNYEFLNDSMRRIAIRLTVFKLFFLALDNISRKWAMPIREWKAALNRFTIMFGERVPNVYFKNRLHKLPDTLR
ncbi:hypothetical protein AAKU61_004608, partial [Undibacterium sp. GrIS 1.2]